MQWLYLVFAIIGAVLPLSQLIPFLAVHGFDLPLFFKQLFLNDISAFFGMELQHLKSEPEDARMTRG